MAAQDDGAADLGNASGTDFAADADKASSTDDAAGADNASGADDADGQGEGVGASFEAVVETDERGFAELTNQFRHFISGDAAAYAYQYMFAR